MTTIVDHVDLEVEGTQDTRRDGDAADGPDAGSALAPVLATGAEEGCRVATFPRRASSLTLHVSPLFLPTLKPLAPAA